MTPDYFDLDVYRMKRHARQQVNFRAEFYGWLKSRYGLTSAIVQELVVLPSHQREQVATKLRQLWRKYGIRNS